MTETIVVEPTPQNLATPKTIVFKTLVDPTMVKLTAEKLKSEVFTKFGFIKPPLGQIQQKFIEKDYEVYLVVDGKYTLDYYRNRKYAVSVDGTVQEVVLLNQTLKPEPMKNQYKKSVTLEGQERIVRESKACIVVDANGREISPKRIPSAPSEEQPEQVLAEFQKIKPLETPPTNGIDLLRKRIVKRPSEMEKIIQETFEITDHAIVYKPVYRVRLQNIGTGQEKIIKIDAVTGKPIY